MISVTCPGQELYDIDVEDHLSHFDYYQATVKEEERRKNHRSIKWEHGSTLQKLADNMKVSPGKTYVNLKVKRILE